MRPFLILLLCFIAGTAKGQSTCGLDSCTPVGEPDVSDCAAGLDKYLARAMSIKGLVNYNAQVPWVNPCNDPEYACAHPLKDCPNGWCPTRYCEDISMAVKAKAALLLDVTSTWGDEWKLVPGTSWYGAASKCVQDINRAYDCAGLRRPIIGASILEWVSKAIEEKPIPDRIVEAFRDDPDFKASDFPKGVFYDITKIQRVDRPGTPDIAKLQARMWVYQCATIYIDMGYKQLGLDVVGWSLVNGFESARIKSYELLTKIRTYAKLKGSFVLLSSSARDKDWFYEGKMLFDFRVSPLRPMETKRSPFPACTGPNYAIIDPKIGETYTQTGGGTAASGCVYDRIPFVVVFDNHSGICGTPGIADKLDYCVYGYDESTWFNSMPDECQKQWLGYAVRKAREISPRGYVAMPAKLYIGPEPSSYRLYDHPLVFNTIKDDLWRMDTGIDWQWNWRTTGATGSCGGGNIQYKTKYTFATTAVDLSGVITWEIQKPDSNWEQITYGAVREYHPSTSGYYTIIMRQNNLALSTPVSLKKRVYLEATVCRNIFKVALGIFGI